MNIFETLKQIEEASGNAKVQLLSEHPELKPILKATYDPFQKYYITAPEISCNGNKDLVDNSIILIDYDGDLILKELNSRKLSGNEAFEIVSAYLSTLTNESADLFQKILNKDLRIGVSVKTINKVWPGFIPLLEDGETGMETFLVSNIDWKRVPYPCLCAPKLDGVRGRYKGKMYSRQGKIILGLDHIERECAMIGNNFDGEIMVNSSGFDSASGLIRNHNPVPEATYHIFDIPGYDGNKTERQRQLVKILNFNPKSIFVIPHYIAKDKDQLMSFYKMFLAEGYEGLVLYDPEAYYSNGRGKEMMRIVPLKDADLKVIGFEEGKGKLVGSLGKIIVDFKGKEAKVGSGFKEKMFWELSIKERNKINDPGEYDKTVRSYIWSNQNKFLGKIAHVKYKEDSSKGSMRQARFKGWREDKTEPNWN